MSVCTHCQSRPIPPGNRRYCAVCSPLASRLWKRRERARWRTETPPGSDAPLYLDGWESREAYRAYHRRYMRAWRQRKRLAAMKAGSPSTP